MDADLVRAFERRYGRKPARLARARARVNVIGKHIDSNGLQVFPLAIQRGVNLAFETGDGERVHVVNDDARFPAREFVLGDTLAPTGGRE